MKHSLNSIKPELAHDFGLLRLFLSIVNFIYKRGRKYGPEILEPIFPGLNGASDEAESVFLVLKNWLLAIGIANGLGSVCFVEGDMDKLTVLVFHPEGFGALIYFAFGSGNREAIREIYQSAF